jgi:Domain of unknown function (DUF1772)
MTVIVVSMGQSLTPFFETAMTPPYAAKFVSTLFSGSVPSRVDRVIEIIALMLMGPLLGVEFGVAAFTNPIVGKLPDSAFRQFHSGGARLLGAIMPCWYVGTLAALIVAAVSSRNGLLIAAVALMGAAALLSVTKLVPINNRIAKWATDADVSRELANRWSRLHWIRVALLAALWLLLAISAR